MLNVLKKSYKLHFKATLSLGLPLIGSHLMQMVPGLTDTIMLGWYGVDELAASVLAHSLFFIILIVGSGFAITVMPMVASAAAIDDKTSVRRSVRMGLWISIIYSIFFIPILLFSENLFLILGQEEHLAKSAQTYLRIAGWSIVPGLLIMVLKSFFSALERPNVVLLSLIIGGLVNIVLNYTLIFGNFGMPELGLTGAAIATLVTTILSILILLYFCLFKDEYSSYLIFNNIWRLDIEAFKEVFKLGLPVGITMLAESGLFSATAVMMGWLGTNALAAHGIAIQISGITFMVYLGLANAGTVRVGRAVGRMDNSGLKLASISVIILTIGAVLIVAFTFLSVPKPLLMLFLSPSHVDTPSIILIGVPLLAIAAIFQIADGLQVVVLGLLRGLKDTAIPMVITTICYWGVGIPCSYLFGFVFNWGGNGIWFGLVIGLTLASAFLSSRYINIIKKNY
ncbi:MATE family efflux transporter [Paracoccaceae bacterium]|jgi:MATE family multidrug resistance protein|nr:MATE family efflux transporter [Paracoccaceae bacterium]|tara:strand:- start:23 stop:1384 length:1362 start_codon:yes stop_codon:yes gene_type:complete